MSLQSAHSAIEKSRCAHKYLSLVSVASYWTSDILWKCESYQDRKKWALTMLREARVGPTEGRTHIQFATKVDGVGCVQPMLC